MRFHTGIALHHNAEDKTAIAAVTWYTHPPNSFSTREFTLQRAKDQLLSTVVIFNQDPVTAVNAACHRTIETLLIKQQTPPGKNVGIELLVRPQLAKHRFILPSKRVKSHWLINAADTVLLSWLRGER